MEIWHGWGYARAHRDEFEFRRHEIIAAARKMMSHLCIFVADVSIKPRILEPQLLCDMPDRGTQLAPRWPSEPVITVVNQYPTKIHGLNKSFDI